MQGNTIKRLITPNSLAGLFVLLALLISNVSHSHEPSLDITQVEQLDCKLCQTKSDPKLDVIKVAAVNLGTFNTCKNEAPSIQTVLACYNLPGQRAPPAI